MKIVITGGHHSSALPVIKELKERDPNITIYWFGHKYSMLKDTNTTLEYRQITQLNIPFYDIKAGKVYKTFNISRLLKVPYGFFQSFALLFKLKPDLILSFGGYLAAPTVFSGWLLRIPSITHEQTLVVGYANKFISKFAKKILVSWESSAKFFPKHKVLFTGLPLRQEIFKVLSNNYEVNKDLPTVYITAGKTGSHIINEKVKKALPELLTYCNVIHQCGDHSLFKDADDLMSIYQPIKDTLKGKYFVKNFILDDEIGEVFSKSNCVISRSGAHIVAELFALRKPAILIPISWVSHNEQYENAKFMKSIGLAEILEEKDLSYQNLNLSLKQLLNNISAYKIKENIVPQQYLKSDSAKLIVDEIYKVLNETK